MIEKVRLDKFLWAVRLFKKRPDAASACSKGAILVDGMPAKQSRSIVVGNKIHVKNPVSYRVYEVVQLVEKRIGAKLVADYITEVTGQDDLLKLKMYHEFKSNRLKYDKPGRPTKKDRRDIDKFMNK